MLYWDLLFTGLFVFEEAVKYIIPAIMEDKEILREKFLEIVENQIKFENPPETKITYKRLIGLGYSKIDSKKILPS